MMISNNRGKYTLIIGGFILIIIFILTTCKRFDPVRLLQLNSPRIVEMVDSTTVVVQAEITDLGENSEITPGFCWSEDKEPTMQDFTSSLPNINTWTTFSDTIRDLEEGTIYYLRAYVIDENAETFYSDSTVLFRTGQFLNPILSTDSVKVINATSARVFGSFVDQGNLDILQYGHCWSESQNPKVGVDSITRMTGTPDTDFSSLLAGLSPENDYYAISYAITSRDTVYADSSVKFTTKLPGINQPVILTDSSSSIKSTSAKAYGTIVKLGTDDVTQHGHCWSNEKNPTVLLTSKTELGSTNSTGSFESSLTGLVAMNTYYYRAYAMTNRDTVYGDEKSFKTSPTYVQPTLSNDTVIALDTSRATAYGIIEVLGSDEILQHGHCWNLNGEPTVESSFKTNFGSKMTTGTFESQMLDLIPDTVYYVRSYIITESDTIYGERTIIYRTPKPPPPPLTFTDDRDGQKYLMVQIGDQWWMVENLNYYVTDTSWYYEDDTLKYSEEYGRLYNWDAALNACPSGWKLPSDDDWKILEETLGMPTEELNSTGLRGTDQADQLKTGGSSGFNAKLSGIRYESGAFYGMNVDGYYWTSTSIYGSNAWYRRLYQSKSQINRIHGIKVLGLSVRCLKIE